MATSPDLNNKEPNRSESVHPIVWAAIGGGVIAIGVLVVGLVLSTNEKGSAPPSSEIRTAATVSDQKPVEHSDPIKDVPQIPTAMPLQEVAPVHSPPVELTPDELFRRCSPSVVSITVKNENGRPIFSGSGFVIDRRDSKSENIELVTNYHVIRGAVDADVEFENGEKLPVGRVLAENEPNDVVILEVKSSDSVPPALALSNEAPSIGKAVFAIGSPEGLRNTLSPGIAQGLRKLDESKMEYLQFSAPISHGSSGGPLLDARGLVVGVTTLILRSGQNLNFAVPSQAIEETLSHKTPREVWRGASVQREESDALNQLKSVLDKEGRPSTDAAVKFAQVFLSPQKTDWRDRRLTAEAARTVMPKEFEFLVDYEISHAYRWMAMQRSIADGTVPDLNRNSEEYKKAIAALESAVQLNPKFSPAWSSLSGCRYSGGEYAEALTAANEVVNLVPSCATAYSDRARRFKELKRFSNAIEDYQTAISLDPANHFYYEDLAAAFRETGALTEAIDSLKTALGLAKEQQASNLSIWQELGETYWDLRNYRKALAAFEAASKEWTTQHGKPLPYLQQKIVECEKALAEQ